MDSNENRSAPLFRPMKHFHEMFQITRLDLSGVKIPPPLGTGFAKGGICGQLL
jgi:hypothetical protein